MTARATLLATGGAGQVFAETTNPPVATGDGVAMAWRAGAALLDMEFVQFHPTALALPGAPRFLISEAVRGEGARLVNGAGERFVEELLPRDEVARAIFRENRAGRGPVALDLRDLDAERVRTRFPRIHATCLRFGVDITREPVPVTPAAHYLMGGVASDLSGRTSLPGLYAAGEAAASASTAPTAWPATRCSRAWSSAREPPRRWRRTRRREPMPWLRLRSSPTALPSPRPRTAARRAAAACLAGAGPGA